MAKFLVAFDSYYVRDAQVAQDEDVAEDHLSDKGFDAEGHLVIGEFQGANEEEAISQAAVQQGVTGEALVAWELK